MSATSKECDVMNDTTDGMAIHADTGASGDTDPGDQCSSESSAKKPSVEFKVPNMSVKPDSTPNDSSDSNSTVSSKMSNAKLNQSDILTKHKKLQSKLSPAELLKHSEIPIPYKEPVWSGLCPINYRFEVIKNGTIVTNIDLTTKSFYVFGRLPTCDIPMEHPSLSRHHAIVQHCKQKNEKHNIGWYLYDLGSTHGTWLNKQKIEPKIYYRLKVGHIIKFGGSTRLHILQGPEEDKEDESELSLTEMKEQREQKKRELEILKLAESIGNDEKPEQTVEKEDACSWGFGEDAKEVETRNPFASLEPENEELYIDDPKKSLKGFFEREGFDLPDYLVTDLGRGKYQCTVDLPVDSADGEPVVAEATVSGKKKEAVVACALEACRILDRMGELRKATHESRKKKAKNWEENDFYDSDDDTFLDRTGDIERKRRQRMQRLGKDRPQIQNYQAIMSDLEKVETEMAEIQVKLDKAKAEAAAVQAEEGLDALDAFMANIKSGAMDSKTRTALKRAMFDLKQQQAKLQRLANVARPADFKLTKPQEVSPSIAKHSPTVGKMKMLGPKQTTKSNIPKKLSVGPESSEFVEEEDEEEFDGDNKIVKKERTESDGDMETDCTMGETEAGTESKQQCTDSHSTNKADSDGTKKTDKRKSTEKMEEEISPKRQKSNDNETESETKINQVEDSDIKSTDVLKSGDADIADANPIKGPSLPPVEFVQKKPRPPKKSVRKRKEKPIPEDISSTDPDYQTWLPPENQSGDGKTSLNEKFGY